MSDYIHYLNGTWEKATLAKIPFNDAGFLLGDGLFETIRFDNNKLFQPIKHLERLFSSLNIIHINLQYSKKEIEFLLNETIIKNALESGLLRLMVTRGDVEGPPWKYNGPASIYISIRPLSIEPKYPVKVVFYSELDYPIIRYTPAIKSMNYIGNMLAKKDAEKENAFEPVFYNSDNYITECAIRNMFFIKNKTILTPSKQLGVLPGVMRDTILLIAKDLQFDIKETNIPLNSIKNMDEAFISSTGIGLLPCFWDGWKSDFVITSKIKEHLNQLIKNY
tara:strand:- start:299 stop:1132 length:834 start_codon:yes stop_codon:yes gene_type:complete